MYCVTGAGIYQDSVQVRRSVLINNPLLNRNVQGQDSVQAGDLQGPAALFGGDTLYEGGGLGTFVSGAAPLLANQGGSSPPKA